MDPFRMSISTALSGFIPPDFSQSYNYCALCCDAVDVVSTAYLNPEGSFFGIKSKDEEKAKEWIKKLNVKNVKFFNEINEVKEEIPEIDFLFVSSEYPVKDNELKELFSKLKEDSLLCIEYCSIPGYMGLSCLWNLIKLLSKDNIEKGLYFLRLLARRGMLFLQANPFALQNIRVYLNRDIDEKYLLSRLEKEIKKEALYFYEIYDQLKNEGFEFIGSLNPALNDLELSVPPAQVPTFFEIDDIRVEETLKDFIRNTTYRRDLFSKNAKKDPEGAYNFLVEKDIKIFNTISVAEMVKVVQTIGGARIALKGPIYDKIFKAFEEEKKNFVSIKEIQQESLSKNQILKAIRRIVATDEFALSLKEPPLQRTNLKEIEEKGIRLIPEPNQLLLEEKCLKFSDLILLSELTKGYAVELKFYEALILLSFQKEKKKLFDELKKKIGIDEDDFEKNKKIFLKRKIPLLTRFDILKEKKDG